MCPLMILALTSSGHMAFGKGKMTINDYKNTHKGEQAFRFHIIHGVVTSTWERWTESFRKVGNSFSVNLNASHKVILNIDSANAGGNGGINCVRTIVKAVLVVGKGRQEAP